MPSPFGTITSRYGYRNPPKTNQGYGSSYHRGIDVAYPVGTNLVTNTKLTYVGPANSSGGGFTEVFTDDSGNRYQFLHLSNNGGFTPGQTFNPGDTIAVTGNSGNSSGAHLDFRLQDKNGNYVDPLAINPETGKPYAGVASAQGTNTGLGGVDKVGDNSTEGTGTPGGTNINNQDVKGQGAAGAGGSGGGAACAGAGLSAIAGIAMGGLMQGLGMGLNGAFGQLTNALSQIPGVSAITGAFQQASSLLGSVPGLNTITGGVFGQLSQLGASIAPGLTNVIPNVLNGAISQLTGPLTSIISNPLSLPGVIQQFAAGGGLPGFLSQVGNNMVGNFVNGSIANLTSNLQFGSAFSEISRNITGGIGEAMNQTFGNALNGVGEAFRNMDGMVTYGLSSLSNNLGGVAANMIATGNWDTSQLTRLMAPGAIAQQIIARGLGDVTGLTTQLINANIPIAGVNNSLYDNAVGKILSGINSTGAIDAVKQSFAVTNNLENLGNLTDISKMMPDVAKTLPVKSFEGLGQDLIKLQITEAPNLTALGSTLLKIENSRDLNHISQLDTPMHRPTGELILKTFGFGSGTYGELTTADFMGTPAGIVHNDTMPLLIGNINFIYSHPDAQGYFALVQLLNEVLNGQHRNTVTSGGGPDGSGGTLPTVTTTTIDPPATAGYTFGSYSTLDDAVVAIIQAIETELQVMFTSNDEEFILALEQINIAHTASISQVLREAHVADLFEVNFLEPEKMTPLKAYLFTKSLEGMAERTGYGQTADIIERLAQDNLYGDAIIATMRQARNAQRLEELGINTERLKVPTGDYYRNPLDYMQNFYQNNFPEQGTYTQPVIFPTTAEEKYIVDRDSELYKAGYTIDDLKPAEKDETYYDLQWTPDFTSIPNQDIINREIGEQVVGEALKRNLLVLADNIEMVGLDRRRTKVGTIKPNGIEDYDYDSFISTLFDIVNKILYGNIGVTKLNNPFHTDEIIYGVAEALGAVNISNIDLLQQSYIGNTVLGTFLTKVANRYSSISTVNDTRMDRNDPSTFGGVGPGLNNNINS